mmetsp:Transcript_61693/g.151004  ORF Transcript_61693/g.151004 Transcript_61693/m.151004 type:complete len:82 (+) Transcript_61693:92-337(+)
MFRRVFTSHPSRKKNRKNKSLLFYSRLKDKPSVHPFVLQSSVVMTTCRRKNEPKWCIEISNMFMGAVNPSYDLNIVYCKYG